MSRPQVLLLLLVLGSAALALTWAPSAFSARDAEPSPAPDEVARTAAYQAHLAANDAAAERWRAAHGEGRPLELGEADPPPFDGDCPEGTQFWQRDRLTELCATPCTSDLDCAPEEGRCRVIDVYDESNVPAAPLVDDTAPEEIEALLTDETRPEPPLLLCDPFWDLVDLPDLALFEVESAAAE